MAEKRGGRPWKQLTAAERRDRAAKHGKTPEERAAYLGYRKDLEVLKRNLVEKWFGPLRRES